MAQPGIITKGIAWLRREPASFYITILGTLTTIIVAAAHLDPVQAGYLATIVTSIGTILTSFMVRPWHVAAIAGAAGTFLQALIVFNLKMPSADIAAVTEAVSLILGYLAVRPQVSPHTAPS